MPGADPETYKSLYRVGDMSPLFFSFSKKLFILVSMLRINFDMGANLLKVPGHSAIRDHAKNCSKSVKAENFHILGGERNGMHLRI